MFAWIIRGGIAAFAVWTMSIPGTECYIAPPYWMGAVAVYLYCFKDS